MASRRLTAILAADVAGYSALMGVDDERTVKDLKNHQSAVFPLIEQHGGRIIDTAGDGVLAEFPSAVEAVRCAVAIQKTVADLNKSMGPDRRLLFRIGVNLGDVIFDEGRIYGDGVNIAARLEGIATPGGICISRSVFEQVANKLDQPIEDLGEKRVKNIAQPVHVFSLSIGDDPKPASPPSVTQAQPGERRRWWRSIGVAVAGCALVLLTAYLAWRPHAKPTPPVAEAVGVPPESTAAAKEGRPASIVERQAPGKEREPATAREGEQPAATAKSDQKPEPVTGLPGLFDGTWEVVAIGGETCPVKSTRFILRIEQGVVLRSQPHRGFVAADGSISFYLRGRADRNVVVEWTGRLAASTGRADYRVVGGTCRGVGDLRRVGP